MSSVDDYMRLVQQYSAQYGVNPLHVQALINTESSWNPAADNPRSSAYGMGQFIKSTREDVLKRFGVDAWGTPAEQIQATVLYWRDRLRAYGYDVGAAIRAYKGADANHPQELASANTALAQIASKDKMGAATYGAYGENPDPAMAGDMTGRAQAAMRAWSTEDSAFWILAAVASIIGVFSLSQLMR